MDGVVVSERRDGALRWFVVLVATALVAILSWAAPVASAAPPAAAGPMTPVFGDEFGGLGLNTSIWTPGWLSGAEITGPMTDRCVARSNVSQLGDGLLRLKLTLPDSACGSTNATETGALVESSTADGVSGHVGFSYNYGYVEWNAQMPAGTGGCGGPATCIGATPQLWSMPDVHDFEIDAMEGYHGQACANTHGWVADPGTQPFGAPPTVCAPGAPLTTAFHTYGALWTPNGVAFYYDGQKVGDGRPGIHSTSNHQFLVMDIINQTGTAMAATKELLVDYVRVWQPDGDGDHLPDAPAGNSASDSDLCPTAAGPASLHGCPDTDGDGVADRDDACPTAAGPASTHGCPDTDGDGVADRDDACTYVPGSSARSGCPPSRPASTRDAATGRILVAYVGADDSVYIQFWDGTSWSTERRGGEPVALGTSPAVVRDWATGRTEIYYTGADGYIWEHAYVNGVWTNENRGSEPAFNASSPSVVRAPASNLSIIAYTGADRSVWMHVWSQGAWSAERRDGPLAAPSTSPTIVRAATGRTDVFYRGADGQVWQDYFNGVSWSSEARGGEPVQAGASPAAVEDPSGNRVEAFYVGADGHVWEHFWNGSAWSNESRGGAAAAAGSTPSVARDATANRTLVAYTGANNYIWLHTWIGGAWSNEQHAGEPVAPGASPSLAWDPSGSKVDVFYTGSDNGLWLWYGTGSAWANERRAF
jgi:Glycosyl hydrolases family 16